MYKSFMQEVTSLEKKLYRIEEGKKLCDVCAGLAEYLNIDPTVVRVGCAVLCCCAGSGVLLYIVAALVMPVKPKEIE